MSAGRARPVNEPNAPDLAAALEDPRVYGAIAPVAVRDTALSRVYLTGDRAFKLKKPVRLPFLDYSTPARRRLMCREEVRLNRRLAPSIYLGVRSVVRTTDGVSLSDESDERALDHVVEMRRFSDASTLASVLERGEDGRIAEIARVLQRFHSDTDGCRPADVLGQWRRTLDENFGTLVAVAAGRHREIAGQRTFSHAYLERRGDLLVRRAATGHVRDGHGDLRADHVLLEEQISIVDCLEFDAALRRIDVSADVAYLVVDLERRRFHGHARELVEQYRAAGGDVGDDSLLSFFCAYRALVAAKVTLLRGLSDSEPEVERLFALAGDHAWRARRPIVIVVCGPSASGKSLLAGALGRESGLAVFSSDRVRKELTGVGATDAAPTSAYADAMTRRTYRELGRRAAAAVGEAGGVVVDATFLRSVARTAFLEEYTAPVEPVFLRCRAPEAVLRRRLALRRGEPGQTSDATEAVLERQLATAEPMPSSLNLVDVPTDAPPEDVVRLAVSLVDRHLRCAPIS